MRTSPKHTKRGGNPWATDNNYKDWYGDRWQGLNQRPHYNATIIGHAFYLMSQGGWHARAGIGPIPVIEVPWIGFHKTMQIFNHAMRSLPNFPTFLQLRERTEIAATALYPGQPPLNTVKEAWDAVGVKTCIPPEAPPPTTNGTLIDVMCRGEYHINWPQVVGAATYHGQALRQGYPWTLAEDIIDANIESCSGRVRFPSEFRLRACNHCGCSAWQYLGTIQIYTQCP